MTCDMDCLHAGHVAQGQHAVGACGAAWMSRASSCVLPSICAVSPMGGGVLFWTGATRVVLASFLSKLWSHHPFTALGSESHTGNAVGHGWAEQSRMHTALHTHVLKGCTLLQAGME